MCLLKCTLLDADSSGPREGSKATPNRTPLPKEPVLLRVEGWEGRSEMIESPSRKFSVQKGLTINLLYKRAALFPGPSPSSAFQYYTLVEEIGGP